MNKLISVKIILLFLIFIILPIYENYGQVITGRVSSYMYGWQIQDQQSGSSEHMRWYQTLVMNVKNVGSTKVSFHTNIRYTKDFINDSDYNHNWKFQYFYGQVKNVLQVADVKFGRHYVYSGVGNGSIDGISTKIKVKKIADFEFYGGMPVSWYHEIKLQKWNESRMYGFRIQPRIFLNTLVSISYVQKKMNPLPYKIPGKFTFKKWDITSDAVEFVGLDFYTQWSEKTNAYGRLDWDMTYHDIYRINFYYNRSLYKKFSLSAEYYYRKPRVYNNSIFSVFAQHDNQEYWLRIYYNIKENLSVSGGTSIVIYSGDKGYRHNVSIYSNRFSIGYNHTSGYSGRLDGLTGSVNYLVRNNIWLKGGTNISRYKLFEHLEDFENVLSAFAGISIMPKKTCTLDIEGQGLHNYNHSSDFRLLLRANCWFSFGKIRKN